MDSTYSRSSADICGRAYEMRKKSSFEAKEDKKELGALEGNFCYVIISIILYY